MRRFWRNGRVGCPGRLQWVVEWIEWIERIQWIEWVQWIEWIQRVEQRGLQQRQLFPCSPVQSDLRGPDSAGRLLALPVRHDRRHLLCRGLRRGRYRPGCD